MEANNDRYHTDLLVVLKRHRGKFRPADFQRSPDLERQGRPEGRPRENPLLRNHREFFETGLLRILSRNDLDPSDIQLLPWKAAQELLTKLSELFALLDEIANDSFKPPCGLVPSLSNFQPLDLYPQLEKVLSILDQSKGPFDLASGTSTSLFRINTLASGLALRSLVRELNHILDGINLPSPKIPPNTTLSSNISLDNWIQSLDQEYRKFVGEILETIQKEFSECGTEHQAMIQLHEISTSGMPRSNEALDIYLYCPKPQKWQRTRCMLNA